MVISEILMMEAWYLVVEGGIMERPLVGQQDAAGYVHFFAKIH